MPTLMNHTEPLAPTVNLVQEFVGYLTVMIDSHAIKGNIQVRNNVHICGPFF
jgi:hypothetical protein